MRFFPVLCFLLLACDSHKMSEAVEFESMHRTSEHSLLFWLMSQGECIEDSTMGLSFDSIPSTPAYHLYYGSHTQESMNCSETLGLQNTRISTHTFGDERYR